MSQWVTLEPRSSAVEAGESVVVDLTIRNTGDIVEEYHVDVVGDPAVWCTVEPSAIRLYPGTAGSVSLTFAPPRASDSAAGPHPYGVRVTALENPDAVTVPEGTLTVASFVDVRAELVPSTVRGWRRAKPRLVVSNYGNGLATASVSASGQGDQVDFDIRTPNLQVQPGRAHFSVLRLRPQRLSWFGQRIAHPFTATVHLSGRQPVTASGTFQQSALVPRWLSRLAGGLTALVVAFAALWLAIHPSVASDTTAHAALSGAPTVQDPSSSSPPLPPQSSQQQQPAPAGTTSPPKVVAPPAGTSSAPAVVTVTAKGSTAPPSSAPVVVPSPVANWILNQTVGNVAVDSTNVHNGTASYGWWAGASCLFDGTNSQIFTNGPVVDTGPGASFTVLADVYLAPTTSGGKQTMVSQDGTQNSGFYLEYMGDDSPATAGLWAFARMGSDTPNPAIFRTYSTAKAATGVWTRLAGVYDASDNQLRLFVNGQLQQAAAAPTPFVTSGPLVMGRAQFNGQPINWFHGALSNVEVFNQALNAAQITAIPMSH